MRFDRNQLGHDEVRMEPTRLGISTRLMGLMGISQATTIGVYIG